MSHKVEDCDPNLLNQLIQCFSGPPGSGKTLLLLLKAVEWVEQGDDVVVTRGPGNLPGHLISQVLHGQIVSTLNDESLKKRVHLETITAWTDPELFINDMVKRLQREGRKVRFLVDELWLANPSSKVLGLARQILELLQVTKKSVESDSRNATGSLSGLASDSTTSQSSSETRPSPAPPCHAEPLEAEKNKGVEMLEALNEVKEKLESLNTVHEIAKASLTAEAQIVLKKLSSAVEEMKHAFDARGENTLQYTAFFCFSFDMSWVLFLIWLRLYF